MFGVLKFNFCEFILTSSFFNLLHFNAKVLRNSKASSFDISIAFISGNSEDSGGCF